MSWRLQVRHITRFQYESEVTASFNEARMLPHTDTQQMVLRHEFRVNPIATIFEYKDYFGTQVKSFDVQLRHNALEIISESTVDTSIPVDGGTSVSWEALDSESIRDEFAEYLTLSALVDPIKTEINLRTSLTPRDAVEKLNDAIRNQITYTSGATHVYSPASEAWAKGAGVCQDFTHASLSLLREANIPARYISGYLYTGNGDIGETVVGESHSWVEAWVGEWIQFDPTNGRPVTEDHVLVARGRDYHDVSPLKGIFSGGRSRNTEVVVELTRLAR
jgi:transglutaminase-like putative cysteine protease